MHQRAPRGINRALSDFKGGRRATRSNRAPFIFKGWRREGEKVGQGARRKQAEGDNCSYQLPARNCPRLPASHFQPSPAETLQSFSYLPPFCSNATCVTPSPGRGDRRSRSRKSIGRAPTPLSGYWEMLARVHRRRLGGARLKPVASNSCPALLVQRSL